MFFLTASRLLPPGVLNRARLLVATLVTALLAMMVGGFGVTELVLRPEPQQWMWLGLSGIIGLTIGDYCGFSGLRILGAQRHSIVSTTAPLAAAICAYLVLGEQLTLSVVAGIGLCIAGLYIALASRSEHTHVSNEGFGTFWSGVVLALAGAVCQGAGLICVKLSASTSHAISPFHATSIRMVVGFFGTYVLDRVLRLEHVPLRATLGNTTGFRSMMMGALFGPIIGVSASIAAVELIPVSLAQTIFSLVPIGIILFNALYHKTLPSARTAVGACLAIIGAIIIAQ
jgi:drug/metabolite transporter (DMT)-like permease